MISESYRALNAQLHNESPDFGTTAKFYMPHITKLMGDFGIKTILDYGCGKGEVRKKLGAMVSEYDPCIPGKDSAPSPAEMVVCVDVLEHIEPEYVCDVLFDLRRVTEKIGMFTVAVKPALKTLPDGRNAHLTVEKPSWWLRRMFDAGFEPLEFVAGDNSFIVVVN